MKLKISFDKDHPPATRGSSWMIDLSSILVSENFGLETNVPFNRTTEQNSTFSRVSRSDAMVMFGDHCMGLSSTVIMGLLYPVSGKHLQNIRKIDPKALDGVQGRDAVFRPSAALIYSVF